MSNNITSNFLNAIQKHAVMQKEKIENDLQVFREKQINEGKELALRDAYNLIQNELSSRRSSIISEYSGKASESRRSLYKRRLEMINEVKSDVIKKLEQFTQSSKYEDYIKHSLELIKDFSGDSSCILSIRPCDKNIIERFTEIIDVEKTVEDESIAIGGVKAYIQDKGIIIDESLDSKLDDKINDFISVCGLKVV